MLTATIVSLIPNCDGSSSADDGSDLRVRVNGVWRDATAGERLAAAKVDRITANRAEARRRIEAKYPLWRQQSAVLGVYPPAYTEQMATDIAAVVQAENTAADAINAATTEAQVAAVTVNWPTL